jgi:predicted thioesterase
MGLTMALRGFLALVSALAVATAMVVALSASPAMAQGQSCTSLAAEVQALQSGLTQLSTQIRVQSENASKLGAKLAIEKTILSFDDQGLFKLKFWEQRSDEIRRLEQEAVKLNRVAEADYAAMQDAARRGQIDLEASIFFRFALANAQQDYDRCVKAATNPVYEGHGPVQ